MNNRETQTQRPEGGRRDWSLLEGLRQFIAARHSLTPRRPTNAARAAAAPARASAFSREVFNRHGRPPVTDTSGFLHFLFTRRAAAEESPGYRAGLVYREPGRTLQQSFYTWFVESVLSLTVHQLEQRLGVWPNLTHAAPTPPSLARDPHPAARPDVRIVFLTPSASDRVATPGGGAASVNVEKHAPTVYAQGDGRRGAQVFQHAQLQTLRLLNRVNHAEALRLFESSVRVESKTVETLRRTGAHAYAAPQTSSTLSLVVPQPTTATQLINTLRELEGRMREGSTRAGAFVAPSRNEAGGRDAAARPHDAAVRIKEVYAAGPHVASAAAFVSRTSEMTSGAAALTATASHNVPPTWTAAPLRHVTATRFASHTSPWNRPSDGGAAPSITAFEAVGAAGWLEQRRAAHLSFAQVETSRVSPNIVLLRAGAGAAYDDDPSRASGRALAVGNGLAAGIGRAFEPAALGRRVGAGGGFTFVRRAEELRPPTQGYALAQPPRPAPAAEPEGVRAPTKAVAEVVRKEVETAMKSRSPINSLTRSDYARIADHVYSSLARRLLIDKERSGLHR